MPESPTPAAASTRRRMVTVSRAVADVAPGELDRLYELMCEHFVNVDRAHFERDFAEKETVFLVRDEETNRIEGFSTLMPLRTELDGEPLVALFTGDTVIDPRYWGDRQFLRVVSRTMFDQAARLHPGTVYWILLTCTHRSYRFLPGLFLRYYPRHDGPIPAEMKRRLDALVRLKFPDEYDAKRGVVELREPMLVRPERIEVPDRQLDDPHTQFFRRINPGHARGDYLACITEYVPENTNALGRRLFGLDRQTGETGGSESPG